MYSHGWFTNENSLAPSKLFFFLVTEDDNAEDEEEILLYGVDDPVLNDIVVGSNSNDFFTP